MFITCEFDQFSKPRGCRKRSKVVVVFKKLFAHRVNATGEAPVMIRGVSYRCEKHGSNEFCQKELGEKFLSIVSINEIKKQE